MTVMLNTVYSLCRHFRWHLTTFEILETIVCAPGQNAKLQATKSQSQPKSRWVATRHRPRLTSNVTMSLVVEFISPECISL